MLCQTDKKIVVYKIECNVVTHLMLEVLETSTRKHGLWNTATILTEIKTHNQ